VEKGKSASDMHLMGETLAGDDTGGQNIEE
jgi:hypothetical protein